MKQINQSTEKEKTMVNIAVMGYGTVGSGVVEVINTNGDVINQRAGERDQY